MDKKVGIVMVNYKDYAARFLAACRDSLRAQDYPSDLSPIYIVDNASSLESAAELRKIYPEACVLPRADGNYAAANNEGFRRAMADGCEYLVTVNMDTEMERSWLSELVRALELDPAAAIAQSKIFLYPKTEAEKAQPRLNSRGNVIHFLGFGFTSGYGEADRQDGETDGYPEITGYASGCSFIIRSEYFTRIGGYNEDFYMYHDDLEISLKTRLAGGKIILAPRSVIFHKYEFSRSVNMLYYMERNRCLTLLMFYPAALLILLVPALVFMDLGLLFYSIVNRWLGTKLRIYGYFLRPESYRRIRAERQKIKSLSAVSFRTVAEGFAGRIEFQEIANPILKHIANPILDLYWRLVRSFI